MRRFRLRLGSLLGIPLWIHVSWFAVLVLVVWTVTVEFGEVLPGLPVLERLSMAAITGVAFFGCLAVHEVAHAVVARRFGVRVKSITLFLFGGVAEIEGELPTPGSEFAVALAGPATSVAIGSVLALAAGIADGLAWTGATGVLFTLALVNLGVAVFNLVPGPPARRREDPAGGDLARDRELLAGHARGGGRRRCGLRRAGRGGRGRHRVRPSRRALVRGDGRVHLVPRARGRPGRAAGPRPCASLER